MLTTTMIYARVHDQTVADDYYGAMERVEKRLELLGVPQENDEPIGGAERSQLLALTAQLAEPELSLDARLDLVFQMQCLLFGNEMAWEMPLINNEGRKQMDYPPPSPVLLGVGGL